MICKKYLDQALEEVHGAEKYIKCALAMKHENSSVSQKYYDMAQEEMKHATTIYHFADNAKPITETEREYMEDQREMFSEHAAKVKVMIASYKD